VSDDERRLLSCVQIAIPGGWPTLVIRPETGFTRVADLAVPDIAFEAEIFNRAFAVRCHDRAFASALVDPRMMEWLLSLDPRWSFEIDGRWILGYRDQVQPWEIEVVLETVESFISRIPRAVASRIRTRCRPDPISRPEAFDRSTEGLRSDRDRSVARSRRGDRIGRTRR
jgi:hypothetical protein